MTTADRTNSETNSDSSEKRQNFDFDGYWKNLIDRFFYPLLKRAVPELYEKAGKEKKHSLLDKEFRDILKTPDSRTRKRPRFADLVIEVPLINGDNVCVLCHIEAY